MKTSWGEVKVCDAHIHYFFSHGFYSLIAAQKNDLSLSASHPNPLERADGALAAGPQGICFFPAMHRYSMNDPRGEPILQAACSWSPKPSARRKR